jgi:hypothetical protein
MPEPRKNIEAPEFLFFSALANSMRANNVRQRGWTGSVLYAEYDAFFYSTRDMDGPFETKKQDALVQSDRTLHTRYHFSRLTLPSMASTRTGKRFLFNEECLESRLGDRYDETVLLSSERLFLKK